MLYWYFPEELYTQKALEKNQLNMISFVLHSPRSSHNVPLNSFPYTVEHAGPWDTIPFAFL